MAQETQKYLANILPQDVIQRVNYLVITTNQDVEDDADTIVIQDIAFLDKDRNEIGIHEELQNDIHDFKYDEMMQWINDIERYNVRELAIK